jgi:UDP-MurNAc hydroxylase
MANLTFINHASYLVESEKSLLIVDPWVEGGAFDNGWSLLDKSINNKTLVKYLAEINKPKYIWLSHEHSDHFSVPFIMLLKESQPEVKFIFQKTLDGRVAQFIRKMGFTVSECNDKPQILDSELSIVTFPYLGGDSYSLTMINNFSLLNINDCVVNDEIATKRVIKSYKKYTNNIDLLLTQFGYANWTGNLSEVQMRKNSAREKLKRISFQLKRFKPKAVIPFASFVYFSDQENFHTNDSQNTPNDVATFFEREKITSNLLVLKPWDILDLKKPLNQEVADRDCNIKHWVNLFHDIKPHPNNKNIVSLKEIKESYGLFRQKIFKHFLIGPQFLERLKFINPIEFYIHDLDVNLTLSYREGLKVKDGCNANADISLSAATLRFTLKNEYGANTTFVNGKFRQISHNGVKIFSRHFSPQEYMKMGYGLNNPITTFRIIVGKLFHSFSKTSWDVNPTQD